jgi:hypothetical protein
MLISGTAAVSMVFLSLEKIVDIVRDLFEQVFHGVFNHSQTLKATHHEAVTLHVCDGSVQDNLLGLILEFPDFLQNCFCKFEHGDFHEKQTVQGSA